MIIYKVTNLLNGKCYIGQTRKKLSIRWNQHCQPTAKLSALNLAVKKYGRENFTVEEIAKAESLDDLNKLEAKFILETNTIAPLGYNLTTGGDSFTMSQATRDKISKQRSGAGNGQFGKKQSEETKRKRSISLTGRKLSEETKAKLRASHNAKSDLNLTYRRKIKNG